MGINGIYIMAIYPLVICYIAMENGPFKGSLSVQMVNFHEISIAM